MNNPAEVDVSLSRWALARRGLAMALGWSALTGSLISLVGGLAYLGYTMSPLSPMAPYVKMDYLLLIVFMGFCLWEGLLAGVLAGLGQAPLLMAMTLGPFGTRRPGQAYRRGAPVIGVVVFLASVWWVELVTSSPQTFLTPGGLLLSKSGGGGRKVGRGRPGWLVVRRSAGALVRPGGSGREGRRTFRVARRLTGAVIRPLPTDGRAWRDDGERNHKHAEVGAGVARA